MRIFVGNLSYDTTEDELKTAFSAHGTVDGVKIVRDHESGRSRGFAFIEMADIEAARKAITTLNGSELGGRQLTINDASLRNKKPRGRRNQPPGGPRRPMR